MKFLYLSDSHFRATRPSCRKDKDFYDLQFKKLEEVFALSNEHADGRVIHGGDFLHVYNSPLGLIHDLLRVLPKPPHKFVLNPGNHDVYGASTDTIRRCGIGVLDAARSVNVLNDGFESNNGVGRVVVRSAPFMVNYPEDFYWFEDKKPDTTYVVLAHDMLTTRPVPFPHRTIHQIKTNADLVLCSHWHSQFLEKVGATWFVNSGPIDVQTTDQRHVKPGVIKINITAPGVVTPELILLKNTGYEEVELVEDEQKDLGLADDFINEVKNSGIAEGADLQTAVVHVARESGYSKKAVDRVLARLQAAQTCVTE